MEKLTAVYPGSFDPITYGHIDIINRSARIFDHVVVLVACNEGKTNLFSPEKRVELIKSVFRKNPKVAVDSFHGLLVDYLRSHDYRVVVRGLRVVSDFEYEFQMALMNRKINPEVETFFMAASEKYSYVSSRILKEVFSLGGCIEGLAPQSVIDAMRTVFHEKRSISG